MFLGLRTVIYPTASLDDAKAWWADLLGQQPYFDEPFYVGFSVGGYELALDPNGETGDGPITYWGVRDCDAALAALMAGGASEREGVREVGGGIRVATVRDPEGNVVGVIENPHFQVTAPPSSATATGGSGR